mmetsp:Transcript_32092/g.68705  ORF Transcript_32092/g.68705 Transcript_32092/m.68705 type:complete len:412 (-) Transcript_32092:2082-3317(-)
MWVGWPPRKPRGPYVELKLQNFLIGFDFFFLLALVPILVAFVVVVVLHLVSVIYDFAGRCSHSRHGSVHVFHRVVGIRVLAGEPCEPTGDASLGLCRAPVRPRAWRISSLRGAGIAVTLASCTASSACAGSGGALQEGILRELHGERRRRGRATPSPRGGEQFADASRGHALRVVHISWRSGCYAGGVGGQPHCQLSPLLLRLLQGQSQLRVVFVQARALRTQFRPKLVVVGGEIRVLARHGLHDEAHPLEFDAQRERGETSGLVMWFARLPHDFHVFRKGFYDLVAKFDLQPSVREALYAALCVERHVSFVRDPLDDVASAEGREALETLPSEGGLSLFKPSQAVGIGVVHVHLPPVHSHQTSRADVHVLLFKVQIVVQDVAIFADVDGAVDEISVFVDPPATLEVVEDL